MKKLSALLLAGCMSLSLVSCGGDPAPAASATPDAGVGEPAEPKFGGSINVGLNSSPVNANIWCQNDLNASVIMNLVCPNPVYMDEQGVKQNYLVESAVANEDCTQWTVTLEEGLCWNDGTPVTSEDLLFTAIYGTDTHIGYMDSFYGQVDHEASHTDGDRTVVFELTSGNVNFWNGGGYWIPIMRKSEWENETDPTTHQYSGDGYGPYFIKEWVDGEYIVLERNPYFTLENDGKGAYLDQVVFRIFTDENAMVLGLQNGEIDVCANFLTASSISQLKQNPNYQIDTVGSLGYTLLTMSQTNELLTDLNVRKAIAMICDRDAMVNVAFSGLGTPMYTPISPVYGDFVKADIRQPAFDPEGAATLLEEAGYKDTDGDGVRESADGKPLSFTLTYKSTLTNVDGVMSILTSNASKAGIELVLQPVDAATYSANVTQGHQYDMSYSSWGTIDDVDTTLLTLFGIGQTLNFMEFNDQEQEDMLYAMMGEVDYNKRVELLNQWQQWFVDNIPCLHLVVPNNTYAASTENYTGWQLKPGNHAFLACSEFCGVYAK